MRTITGDLIKLALDDHFDVIVHGCNCFNTMGSGIARQIAHEFPEAYELDQYTSRGDPNKLGTIGISPVLRNGRTLYIVNAYTQFKTAAFPNEQVVDYKAVQSCFKKIYDWALTQDLRIGIPKIGAGLAGGNWSMLEKIIELEMDGLDLTVVEYQA